MSTDPRTGVIRVTGPSSPSKEKALRKSIRKGVAKVYPPWSFVRVGSLARVNGESDGVGSTLPIAVVPGRTQSTALDPFSPRLGVMTDIKRVYLIPNIDLT
jgi:hypothetical protein